MVARGLWWSGAFTLVICGAFGTACSLEGRTESPQGAAYDHGEAYDTVSASTGGYANGTGGSSFPAEPPEPPPPAPIAPPDNEQTECDGLSKSKPVILYLSSDDSNSMASPVVARERLSAGYAPKTIRTYEFLNYYNVDYPAAPAGQLAIYPQLAPGDEEGAFDLQIGVRSFDVVERKPMTITFSLDTSGSMGGGPIERERATVKAIAKNLAAGDIVNVVTWAEGQQVELEGHTVIGPDDPTLIATANSLFAKGGTDLNAGLVKAYELANEHFGDDRLNRVVLFTDGGANVGITAQSLIAENSEQGDKEHIYLVGVGAADDMNYADDLLDIVTDNGRGAYVYVDSLAEAERMFDDRFDEVMDVAARGVQVQLTLPWYFQMKKFYGEEFSENPDEVEPQHLAPNDAMVFHQVIAPCDAEVVGPEDEITVTVNWTDPATYQAKEASITSSIGELLEGDTTQLMKGKAIVAYAEALRSGENAHLQSAYAAVESAGPATDPALAEIKALIAKHPAYQWEP